MSENAIPISKLNIQKVVEELNPEMAKAVDNDELISRLANYPEWEALRERIKERIKSLENATKVTQATIGLIDDVELYGFKCMLASLIAEELEGIIFMVDGVNKIFKDKKNESGKQKQ